MIQDEYMSRDVGFFHFVASTIEILFDHDLEFEIYNMYMRIFVERGIQISTGGKFD